MLPRFVLLLASLVGTSAAHAAIRQVAGQYTLFLSSSAPLLDGKAVNASGLTFWVGKSTAAYCPLPDPADCASFPNITTIAVGAGSADMYDYAPGGQDIYVAQNGWLQYTAAHEEGQFPPGSYSTGFAVDTNVEPPAAGELVFTGGNSSGWIVCGDGSSLPLQILALVSSEGAVCANAQKIRIFLNEATEVGAFEYD
ncbi:hypothetical protein GQ53DRAFT_829005 [Thozetella sp. PMI_491]|nr:hypothetical protein GQ53DRAFT_829005 [Thozetella sp. PMI_491]